MYFSSYAPTAHSEESKTSTWPRHKSVHLLAFVYDTICRFIKHATKS